MSLPIISYVNFTRLSEEDLLYILDKRNDPNIRQLMVNQEIISRRDHLSFCEKLKKSSDKLYFLMKYNEEKVGVFNFTSIDFDVHTYEPGCYFFDESVPNNRTDIVCGVSYIRKKFKLYYPTIRVKKDNYQAVIFNVMKMNCEIIKEDSVFYYLKPAEEPENVEELVASFDKGLDFLKQYYNFEYLF